jgi:hypothetical protein
VGTDAKVGEVLFSGPSIRLVDFKRELNTRLNVKTGEFAGFDLEVKDPTKDGTSFVESALLPKNSSVVVSRVPWQKPMRGGGPAHPTATSTHAAAAPSTPAVVSEELNVFSDILQSSEAAPPLPAATAAATEVISEPDRTKAILGKGRKRPIADATGGVKKNFLEVSKQMFTTSVQELLVAPPPPTPAVVEVTTAPDEPLEQPQEEEEVRPPPPVEEQVRPSQVVMEHRPQIGMMMPPPAMHMKAPGVCYSFPNCRFGSQCRFTHNGQMPLIDNKDQGVCFAFQSNSCKFGERHCRFKHELLPETLLKKPPPVITAAAAVVVPSPTTASAAQANNSHRSSNGSGRRRSSNRTRNRSPPRRRRTRSPDTRRRGR